MQRISYFSQKPESIHFEEFHNEFPNRVWMRKNIKEFFIEDTNGSISQWSADEVYFETSQSLSEIEDNFDSWYEVGKEWDNSKESINFNALKEEKIEEFSRECEEKICAGVDVTLSDSKTYHFSMTKEDQINLISLQSLLMSGSENVPYHADNELCVFLSAEDFSTITKAATEWKIYQTTYFNSLKNYIEAITNIEELNKTYYGMTVPEEYSSDVLKALSVDLNNYFV